MGDPARSPALPAAAARGSRHRGRMRRGRDGAGGRGRGGAVPDGAAAAGKPLPAPSHPARGSPRAGMRSWTCPRHFSSYIAAGASLLRVFLLPTIWLTRAAHPGGGRDTAAPSRSVPLVATRVPPALSLRCCSTAPALRAAGQGCRGRAKLLFIQFECPFEYTHFSI